MLLSEYYRHGGAKGTQHSKHLGHAPTTLASGAGKDKHVAFGEKGIRREESAASISEISKGCSSSINAVMAGSSSDLKRTLM